MLITGMKRNLFRFAGRRRAMAGGLLAVVVTGLALTVFFNVQKAEAAWWNGSWLYRRKITLNNSASTENLVNFPARVSLSASNINYAHTQNAGEDIRFVDSDDTTALSYEIETWNESGTSEAWVQVPQVNASSSTDFIWIYYGNASATDGQAAASTWSNSYAGVWHMKEDPSIVNCSPLKEVCDSTTNANNADSNGAMTTGDQVAGQINGSLDFDGTNDNLQVADSNSLDITGALTMSAWIRRSANLPGYETIAIKESSSAAANYSLQLDVSNRLDFSYAVSGIYDEFVGNTLLATNTWYYVAVTYNDAANQVILYLNGAVDATLVSSQSLVPNTHLLLIGDSRATANEPWPGIIDELQLSNTSRSAEWIEASYISGSNSMNSFGAEEIYPPDAPVLTALGDSAAVQPIFQLRSSDRSDPTYLRYKVELCSNSDCSSIVRTIDQTSSQTGWSGQDAQTSTAYVASGTVGSSTLASHTYQTPALSLGTQYWWRAYAIDPGGSNTWSEASAIASFITTGPPAAPTLLEPGNGAVASLAPMFRLWTTDPNGDYVQYKIEVCSTSNCSAAVRTIDQTSSQTSWTSQDASSATAYSASAILTGSQPAVHVYQSPLLSASTQYWWRAYAIDPAGYNQWSAASSIGTFTATASNVKIMGGTSIRGGTRIGQ
jgi:hypothetical protein